MQGSNLGKSRMFKKLCGKDSLFSVILVMTMWDHFGSNAGSEQTLEQREEEFKVRHDFWGAMIASGSPVMCHMGNRDSAMRIIHAMAQQSIPTAADIPGSMVNKEGGELVEQVLAWS
jgi:hypothetical protein